MQKSLVPAIALAVLTLTFSIGTWADAQGLSNSSLPATLVSQELSHADSSTTSHDMAEGSGISCEIVESGTVDCASATQYGNFLPHEVVAFPNLSPLTGATQLTAGSAACALLEGGTVDCWGDNSYGEGGNGGTQTSPYDYPVQVSNLSNAVQVSTGGTHTCALISGCAVDCWGSNDFGQLGDNSTQSSLVPVQVQGLSGAAQIATGYGHTCALLSNGTVDCWGLNEFGQVGNDSATNVLSPAPVQGLTDVTQISAGQEDTCALRSDGTVECWGDDTYGQLGIPQTWNWDGGTNSASLVPSPVGGLSDVVQISAGGIHTCALLSSGSVECWGDNTFGELGNGGLVSTVTPSIVGGLSGVTGISSGFNSSCAITTRGTFNCWGTGDPGTPGSSSSIVNPAKFDIPAVVEFPPAQVDQATAISGDASIRVNFTAPSFDGGSPVQSFEASAGQPGSGSQCVATAPTCTIEGLTNGTKYPVWVAAENAIGTSNWHLVGSFVPKGQQNTTQHPKLTVKPATKLRNRQIVMVRGTGFTGGDVVYVEECLRPNGGCDLDKITSVTILANGVLPLTKIRVVSYPPGSSGCLNEKGHASPCYIVAGDALGRSEAYTRIRFIALK